MVDAILRLPAVKARTGLSRSTIYLMVSRNEFPAPRQLGERAVGWDEIAVAQWIASRPHTSNRLHREAARP
jgi:prophage regulatory protein